MKILKKIIVILAFIICLFTFINTVYAEENLEEKIKLIEDCKTEYEKELLKESGTWKGRKYTYAHGYLHGCIDENEIVQIEGFAGGANFEYDNFMKMEDHIENVAKEYFEKFKKSENELDKIKSFLVSSSSTYTRDYEYKEKDDIEGRVSVLVVPESNNSNWLDNAKKAHIKIFNKNTNDFIEADMFLLTLYVHLVWENDKYVIKYIDDYPEGYSEYVARMKENGIDVENINYAELINAKETKQQEIIEAEKKEFNAKQTTINNINKELTICFSGMIFLIIISNIIIIIRKKKK